MNALENKLRVMVSRHNKATGENWHVSIETGNGKGMFIKVYADEKTATRIAKVEVLNKPVVGAPSPDIKAQPVQLPIPPIPQVYVPVEHPTKEEFLSYAIGMSSPSFTLNSNYAHRFEEMVDWILELPGEPFLYEHDEAAQTLTIRRR